MSKLALGTVQFGMSYGISNKHGQTTREQIIKILELAQKNDIRVLDTASSYGNSENILGEVLDDFDCNIILKTPHFNDEVSIVKQLELLNKTFSRSLQRLGRDKAYGLLIESSSALFENLSRAFLIGKKYDGIDFIGINNSPCKNTLLACTSTPCRFNFFNLPESISL